MNTQRSAEVATVLELESTMVSATDPDASSNGEPKQLTLRTFSLSFNGITVHLSNLGASISKILVPSYATDCDTVDDVVLGFRSPDAMYESGNPLFFCSIVGRVANRIANGRFSLPGCQQEYQLETNNGPNTLHGGSNGFNRRVWEASTIQRSGEPTSSVKFALISNDGDKGFPGKVEVTATYSLVATPSGSGATLRLVMKANLLDHNPTPINLANHSYFNLASHNSPKGIIDHKLTMPSDYYTPTDSTSIPTREVRSLDKDPVMDFRMGRLFKDALHKFGTEKAGLTSQDASRNMTRSGIFPDIATVGSTRDNPGDPYGFDHNYVVKGDGHNMNVAGILDHEATGRRLTVMTDAPGVQLDTANYIGGVPFENTFCKELSTYRQWQGVCLETQHYPDSIGIDDNAFPEFSQGQCHILRPGGPAYEHTVEYCFESMLRNSLGSIAASGDINAMNVVSVAERGADSDGNIYRSAGEMWYSQEVVQMEGEKNQSWYGKAENYYEQNCPATVDGVLGGYASISDVDLEGSIRFLDRVRTNRPSLDFASGAACECGAGIGRVSKGLLLPLGVPRCDLVESSSRLLSSAPAYIGNSGADRCRYYCVGLQDWEPAQGTYSIIWIQWVLCYLTDMDAIKFLKRCGQALRPGGVVCLKENTCVDNSFVLDNDDASVTRSLPYLLKLVDAADLRILVQEMQDNFPDELFPVPMLALDVKPASL